ncbi:MAG TPA: hypothetical protein VEX88_14170 [Glaciibacter sp.]|nr:hypothetical protein [Glaciibacter sp.]
MAAGLHGESDAEEGVLGVSHAALHAGVSGVNDNQSDQAGVGVHGRSRAAGVVGESGTWHGVFGSSQSTTGGHGVSGDGPVGVSGVGRSWIGVYGETHGAVNGPAGVWGDGLEGGSGVKGHARAPGTMGVGGFHLAEEGDGGPGVFGDSIRGRGVEGRGAVGVVGIGRQWIGVFGETNAPVEAGAAGVWGDGKTTGDGVKGVATGNGKAAVCGFQLGEFGPGIFGQGNPAGHFDGRVFIDGVLEVTGDVILQGADYAEAMTATDPAIAPGSVVSVGPDGLVRPCDKAYDSAVAGIVSGGGGVRPAVLLDQHDGGLPVALMGKVWCLVDADAAPVRPGDLLTTSSTSGHAQRLLDPAQATGAIVGKALTPLEEGRGMVRVLVATR